VICISLWVAFRFEWQYGVAAAVATGHDVFVTAGLFSVLHLDFHADLDCGAADSGGLFDQRHRGGVRPDQREPAQVQADGAIRPDQPVHQSDADADDPDSVATALSIIPLYFYVPALMEFTGSILFGIVVGTFSSTYVAAALLLYLPKPAGSIEPVAQEA